METIRAILEAHESGISRGGLLAWARLRGDPTMTDDQMEAALAELGDEVIDVQGFLYLRKYAPASALADQAGVNAGAAVPPVTSPTSPPASPASPTASRAPAPGAIPGWVPPGGEDVAPAGPPAYAGAAGAAEAEVPQPPANGQSWGMQPQPDANGWAPPDGGWPPTQSAGGTRTRVVATVAVGVFLLAAGIGAFLLRDADRGAGADATPALPTPTAGSVVGAFAIALGDCIILPSEDQFDKVRRLECADAHDGEVFYLDAYPGSDYPSADAFSSYVDEKCLPAFAQYTGSDFDNQTVLDMGWFTPTRGSWDKGDRDVACYLTPIDGEPTSQSYRGAKP